MQKVKKKVAEKMRWIEKAAKTQRYSGWRQNIL